MKILLMIKLLIIYPSVAYAYIDPGVSAFIIQGLVGALAIISGIYFSMKQKLKSIFKKIFKKIKKSDKNNVRN
jgi:hypothetical protein